MHTIKTLTSLEQQQIEKAQALITQCLGHNLKALYLYGSAIDEGLKPYSDIDLLLVVEQSLSFEARSTLMRGLLEISAFPQCSKIYRALEVTIVVYADINPWHFPAKRDLQFGEWLRDEIVKGDYGRAEYDPDLTILLTQVRNRSIALIGDRAIDILPLISQKDLLSTLQETLKLWQKSDDLIGDERNIILTLARILYSNETGEIISKHQAALWLLPQLPMVHAEILQLAHHEYLGFMVVDWECKAAEVEAFVRFIQAQF